MPPNRWRASVLAIGIIASLAVACQRRPEATTVDGAEEALTPRTFQDDLAFLERHMEVIVLGDPNAAGRVVVSPRWQGRVMTSTANAAGGIGYGWINETLIESGALQPHINAIGGEDRFWLGPEGGQFSIFFAGDDPFDLDHWQTPPSIDSEPYRVVDQDERHVTLTHNAALTNYSGTRFDVRIDRTIRLVDMDDFDVAVPSGVRSLVYESENTITNHGRPGLERRDRVVVDLDSRDVQALARHDSRHPFPARSRRHTGPGGERRLLRQGPRQSARPSRRTSSSSERTAPIEARSG